MVFATSSPLKTAPSPCKSPRATLGKTVKRVPPSLPPCGDKTHYWFPDSRRLRTHKWTTDGGNNRDRFVRGFTGKHVIIAYTRIQGVSYDPKGTRVIQGRRRHRGVFFFFQKYILLLLCSQSHIHYRGKTRVRRTLLLLRGARRFRYYRPPPPA